MKMVKGPEGKVHEEQLRPLGLLNPEQRAELCFLVMATGLEGTAWNCIRGRACGG